VDIFRTFCPRLKSGSACGAYFYGLPLVGGFGEVDGSSSLLEKGLGELSEGAASAYLFRYLCALVGTSGSADYRLWGGFIRHWRPLSGPLAWPWRKARRPGWLAEPDLSRGQDQLPPQEPFRGAIPVVLGMWGR
jgi:hypothetical protein